MPENSLRAYAEQVLFAQTLEGKLASPGVLHDRDPGAPARAPAQPGRPVALRPRAERTSFPSEAELSASDAARGRVLHFFANHELLAIELMALMLLRFPDAPPAFRRGLLTTLGEEQAHLAGYLTEMARLGVAPGEVPVNDYFWRALSTVESPLGFVSGMGLVFEQANLDHALAWRDRFARLGDGALAGLLQRVHDDEVGHVRFGLHWFDRWRKPEEPRILSLERALPSPLTPARARGEPLSEASRKAAGFDDDFIRDIRLYRHAKGRPPEVWCFDVDAEGPLLQPGARRGGRVIAITADLATLALPFANEEDVVLVPTLPSAAWRQQVVDAGLPLPQLVATDALPELAGRTLGGLHAFAWTPDTLADFAPLRAASRGPAPPPWTPQRAATFGKPFAAAVAATLAPDPLDVPAWAHPRGVTTPADLEAAVHEALARTGEVVVKPALGASGRGHVRLRDLGEWDAAKSRLERLIFAQGVLMVEPWLLRRCDLGLQIEVPSAGSPRLVGITRAWYDDRGRFAAASTDAWTRGLPAPVYRMPGGLPALERRLRAAAMAAGAALAAAGHQGPAGVDVFIAEVEGELRVRAVVEINPRYTMGRVALALGRRLPGAAAGALVILTEAHARVAGHSSLSSLAADLRWASPPRGAPRGTLPLADPAQAKHLLPVLVCAESQPEMLVEFARLGLVIPEGRKPVIRSPADTGT